MLQQLNSGHYVWRLDSGERGSISRELLAELYKWRQLRFWDKEAGGVILGFVDAETNGLLAEKLTAPGIGDQRSRTSFFRGPRHQKEAEQWNAMTKGRGTQIGLWHTHPEPNPTPSEPDKHDCKNVLEKGNFLSCGILYVIVGTQHARFWLAKPNSPMISLGSIEL